MTEKELMNAVCKYLRQRGYLFYGDFAAGMYLSMYQARLVARYRSCIGLPDVVVFHRTEQYVGFAFELKKQSPYKKNGELRKDAHIAEQHKVLQRLREMGWYADFVWNLEQVKKIL